eukprot:gnl/TRDRNA2_/TRDRNA2_166076_c0_seq2.p1 gnl/TRDRNA2_/TRDRNA2_166076_c0~~gnl/TRDRNA2_/TRDRNA2_166076_c0_seq2.p1  ORF type:complete len:286 (-),score=51.11 gnl/TRDRNA2_/TRDRNA2_166076_c0_seq2:23-880(-)
MAPPELIGAEAKDGSAGTGDVSSPTFEDVSVFRRWAGFLPRAVALEVEYTAVYVRARNHGNGQFFDQQRENLFASIEELRLLESSGHQRLGNDLEVREVMRYLEMVLQAQWVALGYVRGDGQLYKALTMGELCKELVDVMAERGLGDGLLFWRMLTRANLGEWYARFRRRDQAKSVLKEALELVDEDGARAGVKERIIAGACYSHMSKILLDDGEKDETFRIGDLEIETFERFIWEVSDVKEDEETQAAVLATAYSNRGIADATRLHSRDDKIRCPSVGGNTRVF